MMQEYQTLLGENPGMYYMQYCRLGCSINSCIVGDDSVEWRNNVPFPLDPSYSGLGLGIISSRCTKINIINVFFITEPAPYIPPIDSPPQIPHPSCKFKNYLILVNFL